MSIREITPNFHIFCPKYIPPLSEFSHCFCPNLSIAFARISGKSNGKFGQSQWEIRAKPMGKFGQKQMRKFGKRRHIFRAKLIAFARISHCFIPNFPLLFPEFPMAFARISHCFCPNFSFSKFFGGHSAPCPPPPPPPPTPMAMQVTVVQPRFANRVPKRGLSERSDRAGGGCGVEGFPSDDGREIFLCVKICV